MTSEINCQFIVMQIWVPERTYFLINQKKKIAVMRVELYVATGQRFGNPLYNIPGESLGY